MRTLTRTPQSLAVESETKHREMSDLVNNERDRRLSVGTTVTLSTYAIPIPLQGRERDLINLIGLKDAAFTRLMLQQPSETTEFRDANNQFHTLTDAQLIELVGLGAKWAKVINEASFRLKDNPSGIPDDFEDDDHWIDVPTI